MAAIDRTWVSTTGDFNANASFNPAATLLPTDNLYFNDSSQSDVVSNLSAYSAGGDYGRCWIQSTYEGNIGANGNPLAAPFHTIVHQGSGSLYHNFILNNSYTLNYVVVDSPNTIDAYTLTATDGAAGLGYVWHFRSGGVRIIDYSSITMGYILVGGGSLSRQEPNVTIGAISAGGQFKYRQTSGTVSTKTALGSSGTDGGCVLDGGTLTYEADGTASTAWRNIEITGGRMIYNGTATITRCVISSGTLDMTQDSRAKTITSLTIMPGANFLTHDNITVTAGGLHDLRPKYPILGGSLP